jgi:hypothetical protein
MAEKYTAEGKLSEKLVVAPNGQAEVVLLFPLPRRCEVSANVFLSLVEAGRFTHGNLVFAGKNGKAEYELAGADGLKKVFFFDLIHDNVHEIEA